MKVSIITPTYNCGQFIAETIRSVVAQTFADWEMIIVDDCSTDNTTEIVSPFVASDPRIRFFRNDTRQGAALTRNRALREAQGEYIAFLDSDDLWLPEKLERQLAFMEQNGYAFTYHEYDEIDEQSNLLGVHVGGKRYVGKFDMYSCCWPGCLTVMYHRATIGLIQIADIRKNNDTAMWLQAIRKSPCHLLSETLALYRRRQGSITPPDVKTKILWHYNLFHDAAHMSPLLAWARTAINIVGNATKKIFFAKNK